MARNVRAGIFWDPREPPPPEFRALHRSAQVEAHHVHAAKEASIYDDNTRSPSTQNMLPPLSVSVVAQVVHDTANVSVTQLFQNTTNHNIGKGTYTFPLPTGCTITEFSCRVGNNRIVKGKVKPKQEARDAFDIAASRNQTASLLEQDTPEIFTTTLANIPANAKLRAEIGFVTLLKHRVLAEKVTTTLTIPTYIAPRYDTAQELRHTQTTGNPQKLSIRVGVLASEVIGSVSSGTHTISVQSGVGMSDCQSWKEFVASDTTNDPKRALVRLEDGSNLLHRDFVLDIKTLPESGEEEPQACLEIHPSLPNHKAVMLTIPPVVILGNIPPIYDSEIIFVADRSGSMDDKMDSLKSAMQFFLKGLPHSRSFNIWCFGSTYTSLWERSRRLSESTLEEALSYVSRDFRSDMGGTELLGVLKAIIAARVDMHTTDVVMLTDGEVWRQDETIDFVQQTKRRTKGRVRFFALGIGYAVSHDLIEGIAKAGGGYAEVIAQASQGGWEDRIVAVLRAALTGHVGPLEVDFGGERNCNARARPTEEESRAHYGIPRRWATPLPTPDILMSPADISALNPFLHNRLFFFFDANSSLSSLDNFDLKATAPDGQEVTHRVDVKTLNIKAVTVHKLGARALLGDLERARSWIHLSSQARPGVSLLSYDHEQDLVRHEGESIGTKWSLVSKWTSFYAIEETIDAQDTEGRMDLDEPQIDRIEASDLDLLRPRGPVSLNPYRTLAALSRDNGKGIERQDRYLESEQSDSAHSDGDSQNDEAVGMDLRGNSMDDEQNSVTETSREKQKVHTNSTRTKETDNQDDSPPWRVVSTQHRSGGCNDPDDSIVPNDGYRDPLQSRQTRQYYGPSESQTNAAILTSERPSYAQVASGYPKPQGYSKQVKYVDGANLEAGHRDQRGPSKPVNRPVKVPRSNTYATAPDYKQQTYAQSESGYGQPQGCSVLLNCDETNLMTTRSHSHVFGSSSSSVNPYTAERRLRGARYDSPTLRESHAVPTTGSSYDIQDRYDRGDKGTYQNTGYSRSLFYSTQRTPALSSISSDRRTREEELGRDRSWQRDHGRGRGFSQRETAPSNPLEGYGGGNQDGYRHDATQRHLPRDTVMRAPIYDAPKSTSIMPTETSVPKSKDDLEGESMIHQLLTLQDFDGSFSLSERDMANEFCVEFRATIDQLESHLLEILVHPAAKHPLIRHRLAVTIALIIVLEEKFQSCRDLWVLMMEKAKSFVDLRLRAVDKKDVFQFTKEQLKFLIDNKGWAGTQNSLREVLDFAPLED